MPISHEYQCIFIHIPRTGGSSIEDALALKNASNEEDLATLSGWIDSPELREQQFVSPVLQHLALSEIRRLVPDDTLSNYFVFAIVRNPWDRLLSNYLFERNHFFHFHPDAQAYMALTDYIDQLNPFLRQSQSDFVEDPHGLLDFVGRFENLDSDFSHIAARLHHRPTPLAHLNRTRHEHYSRYYCDESRDKIADLFARDIETFGYQFGAV